MSLIDALGIDPENFDWRDIAACGGMDTDWFYDDYEKDSVVAINVDNVCDSCPVKLACGKHAQTFKEEGVWGGVYWNSSGKPDRARNRHKTDEEWQEVKELYK